MKKLSIFLLALSMVTASVPTRTAQAGITTFYNSMVLTGEDPAVGLLASALSVGLIIGGVQMVNYSMPGGKFLGVALILLDQPRSVDQDEFRAGLERHVSETFPFLDHHESVRNIAQLMDRHLRAAGALDRPVTVSIPAEETLAAIVDAELRTDQVQTLVGTLE